MNLQRDWAIVLRRGSVALAAAVLVQLIFLSYNHVLKVQRRDSHSMATRITAEQVVLRIEAGVQARVDGLQRLVELKSSGESGTQFRDLAEHLLQQFDDFQAINWIDKSGVIQAITPVEGNEGALGRNLWQHPDPMVHAALTRAIEDGRPHRTGIITLLQGGRGFACYLRVMDRNGRLMGVVNGVYRIERLIDACLPEESLRRKYNLTVITDTRQTVYQVHRDRVLPVGVRPTLLPINVIDPGWSFQMTPTRAYLKALSGPFDDALPWIGHLFSLIAIVLVWYMHRWRAESRTGEARFRELFQTSMEGIFILDSQNRLVEVNSAALAIFGYQRAEVLYQPLSRITGNRQHLQQLQNLLLQDGPLSRHEISFTDRDGREKRLLLSANIRLDESGRYDGVMGILGNITEHHLMREQLRQAQKMEAIGHLAGGVAHDFNNLLTVISGNCELAAMRLGEDNPAHVELKEIGTTSGRAANLTRQLLAFSRKQVIRPRLLYANDTLHDMERMLRRIIGEETQLSFQLDPSAWCVKVDPAQLEQVIVNLVVNARDAMETGGLLQVRTLNEHVDSPAPGDEIAAGDYLVIEVSDSGCGIAPEAAERIFEPFYTTKPEGVGTGLGLATVYGIVRQSEGHIQVLSVMGKGTTFRILLPRQQELPQPESQVLREEILRGTETLLVVEDEPAVRRMTVDSLKRQGYIVHEAGNGRLALDLVRKLGQEIDLVVSDVVMPEMGGVEFVTELRQFMPHLPVLFLSGYSEEAIRRHGELQSDARLLQKPFNLHDLHSQVRDLLRQAS